MDPHWPNLHCHNQQQQNQQIIPFINCTPQFHEQNPVVNSASESNDLLQQQMRNFWQRQRAESEQANDYRNHSLPLARIKKIMKSDEDVRMISAEAPVLLSKACEMFIQDLTLRSWVCTEESKRRTLQRADISAALSTTDLFDFLVDIVPREKPIVAPAAPPVMPFMVTPRNNVRQHQHQHQHQHQQDITLAEGAGVGLTMCLPMHLVQNDQVTETSSYLQGSWSGTGLSHQNAWPPPDL